MEAEYYGLEQTRGLENYSNTCWLNSALQCLAQTPNLYDELLNSCIGETENPLEIPGGTLTINDSTITLPQIEIDVYLPGLLTYRLFKTLISLGNDEINTYYPLRCLQTITACLPQFVIGEHNDSHEFVRCLLETLRTEKQDKYRVAIDQSIAIIKETTPEFCPDEHKEHITNFYCLEALKKFPSPLEKYFRGSLQTSLQCVDCKTVTNRQEDFFDLSVPIATCLNYKNVESEFDDSNEFRNIRFMNFINANQMQLLNSKTDQSISLLIYNSMLHNMYVINNYNIVTNSLRRDELSVTPAVKSTSGNGENEMDDGAPGNNKMDTVDCLDVKDGYQIEEHMSEFTTELDSEAKIKCSGYTIEDEVKEAKIGIRNLDLGKVNMKEEEKNPNLFDGKFELSSNDTPMEEEQSKFYLIAVTGESQIYSNNPAVTEEIPEAASINDIEINGDKCIEEIDCSGLQKNEAVEPYENTDPISYPTAYVEDYCLLKTCLDNFFGEELLTDGNKVICEECSKKSGGNETKLLKDTITRFKISIPPTILILHLKRFNFLNGEILKNNKKVLFPTILDMAPYCTTELNIERDSVPLLYSLYAVNEHFGTLNRGHYVSYRRLETNNAEHVFDHTLPGQWVFANDEIIDAVPENYVTNVQAYILFYKRIF